MPPFNHKYVMSNDQGPGCPGSLRKAWLALDFHREGQLPMEELELLLGECTAETQIQYDAEEIQCRLRLAGHRDQFPWEAFAEAIEASCSPATFPGHARSVTQSTATPDDVLDAIPMYTTPDYPGDMSFTKRPRSIEGSRRESQTSQAEPKEATPRVSTLSNASARFQEIARRVGVQSVINTKLGRKPPDARGLATISTKQVAKPLQRLLLTSACERSATQVFQTMPRSEYYERPFKQASRREELERKYRRIDRFWEPIYFVLCLYYFWRIPLAMCFQSPMSWGWVEVAWLFLLATLEIMGLYLALHRPQDVEGQVVYDPHKIRRVLVTQPLFWLNVLSALPVQFALVPWLTLQLFWVPCCFGVKFFKSLSELWYHFGRALERHDVNPIRGRIYHGLFTFLVFAHLASCAFMAVAHREGDAATQVITTVPSLVTGNTRLAQGSLLAWQYAHAVDWAIKVMTGLGRGASMPATDLQHVLLLGTVAGGIVLYAFMITTISDALTTPSLDARHRDHMQTVSDTMAYRQLPLRFRKEVISYYRYAFRTTGYVGGGEEDPLGDLPYDLRSKIDCAVGASLLQRVPIFKEACQHPDFVSMTVEKLDSQTLMPDTVVFHRGTIGDCMYFIVNGQVAVLDDNGQEVVVLGAGSFFGEIAVLSETERTATILTKTYCHVLALSKADFESVGRAAPESVASIKELAQSRIQAVLKFQEQARRTLLCRVPIFTEAMKEDRFTDLMVSSLTSKTFEPESFVCHHGDVGDCMFFLVTGQVVVLDEKGDERETLGPGSFFGDIAVVESIGHTASVVARTFCTALVLSGRALETVERVHPAPVQRIRDAAQDRLNEVAGAQFVDKAQLIASVPLFAEAAGTIGFVRMMVEALRPRVVPADARVCTLGEAQDCMYFVVSGQVTVMGPDLRERVAIGPGSFFGEVSLLSDVGSTGTVRTTRATTLLVLRRADFERCGRAYPACVAAIRAASAELVAAAEWAHEDRMALQRLDGLSEMAGSQSSLHADRVVRRRFPAPGAPSLRAMVDRLPDVPDRWTGSRHLKEMLMLSSISRSLLSRSGASLRRLYRGRGPECSLRSLIAGAPAVPPHRPSSASAAVPSLGPWASGPALSPRRGARHSPASSAAQSPRHSPGQSARGLPRGSPRRRRHGQNRPHSPWDRLRRPSGAAPLEPGHLLQRLSQSLLQIPCACDASEAPGPGFSRNNPLEDHPTASVPGSGVESPSAAPPSPPPPFSNALSAPPSSHAVSAVGAPTQPTHPPPPTVGTPLPSSAALDTTVGAPPDARLPHPPLQTPPQPLPLTDHPSTQTPPQILVGSTPPGLAPTDAMIVANPLSSPIVNPTLGSPSSNSSHGDSSSNHNNNDSSAVGLVTPRSVEQGDKSIAGGPFGEDPLQSAEEIAHPFSPLQHAGDTIALSHKRSSTIAASERPSAQSEVLDHAGLILEPFAFATETASGAGFLRPRTGKGRHQF